MYPTGLNSLYTLGRSFAHIQLQLRKKLGIWTRLSGSFLSLEGHITGVLLNLADIVATLCWITYVLIVSNEYMQKIACRQDIELCDHWNANINDDEHFQFEFLHEPVLLAGFHLIFCSLMFLKHLLALFLNALCNKCVEKHFSEK